MPDREVVMKNNYKGIQNITDADKVLVASAFNRWQQNRTRPKTEDIKLLFAKYHEYIYRSPKDMACPSCVQFIYDYWLKTVPTWHQASRS